LIIDRPYFYPESHPGVFRVYCATGRRKTMSGPFLRGNSSSTCKNLSHL
jgi:hypothetical protein